MEERPLLRRDIQLIPASFQGRRVIALSDPLRLSGGDIALDAGWYPLLEKLDGRHHRRDLQALLARLHPEETVTLESIDAVVSRLDELFLLDSRRFREQHLRLRDAFRHERDRSPAFAGRAYSDDPDTLRRMIVEQEDALMPLGNDSDDCLPQGLLAPHIDTTVAGSVYVDLYRRVRGRRYGRVIVLGINHREQDGLYSVMDKGFLTPFGRIAPDGEFIGELKERLQPGILASDDFGHKTEHSIEFQTLFLQHYLDPAFRIVPVLCGALRGIGDETDPALVEASVEAAAETLAAMISTRSEATLVVAAVDFSHIGFKFGHAEPAPALLSAALENDRRIIECIAAGDAAGIIRYARESGDRFNVCGLPAIVLFTMLMETAASRLLAHETYREDTTGSAVTFASMLFAPELGQRTTDGDAHHRATGREGT